MAVFPTLHLLAGTDPGGLFDLFGLVLVEVAGTERTAVVVDVLGQTNHEEFGDVFLGVEVGPLLSANLVANLVILLRFFSDACCRSPSLTLSTSVIALRPSIRISTSSAGSLYVLGIEPMAASRWRCRRLFGRSLRGRRSRRRRWAARSPLAPVVARDWRPRDERRNRAGRCYRAAPLQAGNGIDGCRARGDRRSKVSPVHVADDAQQRLRADRIGDARQIVRHRGPERDSGDALSSAVVVEDADDPGRSFEAGRVHVVSLGKLGVVGRAAYVYRLGVRRTGCEPNRATESAWRRWRRRARTWPPCSASSDTAARCRSRPRCRDRWRRAEVDELGVGPGDIAFSVLIAGHGPRVRKVVEFLWVDGGERLHAQLLNQDTGQRWSRFAGVVPAFPGHNLDWVGEIGEFLNIEVR